jgi:signal transduction histidine kinase
MIEPQAARRGLKLEVDMTAADVCVHADRERLTQILTNLLTNAIKFTEAGSISVATQVSGGDARILVQDTGRGIPPDKLAAVFEPFVQAGRSAEEQTQGIGLGLSISRELARAMGGELTVQSELTKGSTFTVRLPVATERRRGSSAKQRPAPS